MSQFITWVGAACHKKSELWIGGVCLFFCYRRTWEFSESRLKTQRSVLFKQELQISSNRGPPSRLCRRWRTPGSQTLACTTLVPSPTPPTPPAPASAASACRPRPDTTPTCRRPTLTTRHRTSSPTLTCITARAPAPTSSPWWRRGTLGVSAPLPAFCPVQGPRAPEEQTAWWIQAWTPRARAWRPTAATATPPRPWTPRVAWTNPSGGLIDWQRDRKIKGYCRNIRSDYQQPKKLNTREKKKAREKLHVCLLFLNRSFPKLSFSNFLKTLLHYTSGENPCTVLKLFKNKREREKKPLICRDYRQLKV